ncbi:leucine/isoleucine/valine transporter ATP-binding subunit [Clostridium saccharobutylicum]|nr:leucine/isoleucine/valine transporter ATP-binding subunit [Clostridium saccharobutylicum]
MNPTETDELTAFVKEIKEKFNLSIFMIEHHMNMVMTLSDRIQVFEYGITIAKGTPSEIQNDKKVIEAYLGVSDDD